MIGVRNQQRLGEKYAAPATTGTQVSARETRSQDMWPISGQPLPLCRSNRLTAEVRSMRHISDLLTPRCKLQKRPYLGQIFCI